MAGQWVSAIVLGLRCFWNLRGLHKRGPPQMYAPAEPPEKEAQDMTIASLAILGLRGFATRQELKLATPNGADGSGLTVVVGPNNAGKSTIVEALRTFAHESPSFTEGKRNRAAGERVSISVTDDAKQMYELRTVAGGGSETEWQPQRPNFRILALPSRRHFSTFFGKTTWERNQYSVHLASSSSRGSPLDGFAYRLFEIQRNRAGFNDVLKLVLDPLPSWSIDQGEGGQHYLKFAHGDQTHSSEGMGEGLVSLMVLVDALYDSHEGDVIVIDEPELSLHPAFQRRVSALLRTYSSSRQIVVATHSPYFVDLGSLAVGGSIARVHFTQNGSTISQISRHMAERLSGLLRNERNPHALGTDARESFFLEDRVVLVEGSDDVIYYERVASQLGLEIPGNFFGWGVGGADNMGLFAKLLEELGFRSVAGLVDNDRAHVVGRLNDEFPDYRFYSIPAPDVRTKAARAAEPEVVGLLDRQYTVREEFRAATRAILEDLGRHLSRQPRIA